MGTKPPPFGDTGLIDKTSCKANGDYTCSAATFLKANGDNIVDTT
jgi:hypothetical protein